MYIHYTPLEPLMAPRFNRKNLPFSRTLRRAAVVAVVSVVFNIDAKDENKK